MCCQLTDDKCEMKEVMAEAAGKLRASEREGTRLTRGAGGVKDGAGAGGASGAEREDRSERCNPVCLSALVLTWERQRKRSTA
eukprot:756199-Hanusia_phi.AAC.1